MPIETEMRSHRTLGNVYNQPQRRYEKSFNEKRRHIMSVATVPESLTAEEFLELLRDEPENETWELINGELRKRPMTTRSRKHSRTISFVDRLIGRWFDNQTTMEGEIAAGEARCRLRRDPHTIVGIDLALFAGEEFDDSVSYYDGPPVLAVEILSPIRHS